MSQEIALSKEAHNRIAVRHGLPAIGATMVNQFGIEWRVEDHLFVSTLPTIARQGVFCAETQDPRDLYPVILPQNFSPRLAQFLAETDHCTSKYLLPLDTLPRLRPHSAHPYGHWIDGQSHPGYILMFLDAAHAHETVIAHEIGHIWIDVVEDCEDYRILKDWSDTARVSQWTNLQSFVLDNKVNAVLREKGFDLSVIERDLDDSLASLAAAVLSGYRPPTRREGAFLAYTLATAMLDEEAATTNTLQSLDVAAMVFARDLPDVYELACHLAACVRQQGYQNRASIRKAVDACASLCFAFTGENLNLDTDLIEETPVEAYHDKYPHLFPGWPVEAKLEVWRAMARLRIPADTQARLSYHPDGHVQVAFSLPDGWIEPLVLETVRQMPDDVSQTRTPYFLQKGRTQMNQPTALPLRHPTPSSAKPSLPSPSAGVSPVPPNLPTLPAPKETRGRRNYMPGLARYLSQVRLAEQLRGQNPYIYALNNPTTYTAYTVGSRFEELNTFDPSSVQLPIPLEDIPTPGICQGNGKKPPQKPKPKRRCISKGQLTGCKLLQPSSPLCRVGTPPKGFDNCIGCKRIAGCVPITDPTYTFTVGTTVVCTYRCSLTAQQCDCY